MKFFILLILSFTLISCVEKQTEVKSSETKAIHTEGAEEDCDDKAAQKVEIKEDSISLSNNTGCTLED